MCSDAPMDATGRRALIVDVSFDPVSDLHHRKTNMHASGNAKTAR